MITLKQGLGRLIRSTGDRVVISILDSRIFTKEYGKHFL
jgi:ATP-dependent DNA helicase DinG